MAIIKTSFCQEVFGFSREGSMAYVYHSVKIESVIKVVNNFKRVPRINFVHFNKTL